MHLPYRSEPCSDHQVASFLFANRASAVDAAHPLLRDSSAAVAEDDATVGRDVACPQVDGAGSYHSDSSHRGWQDRLEGEREGCWRR